VDAIILAAGYATRLYPLTLNKPKPLLEIDKKPMIEHSIKKIEETNSIDQIYIVTNDKFKSHYRKWLKTFKSRLMIEIISDGTTSNEDKLGALGDINYVINSKSIDNDLLIIAGDNLFELSLSKLINIFQGRKNTIIVLHDVKDKELAKQYGVVEIKDDIVISFEEKPPNPKSTLISTGIYLFPKTTLSLIKEYINQGNNPDKSGNFIEWLYKKNKVYALVTEEAWYDIGSFEQLERAKKYFSL